MKATYSPYPALHAFSCGLGILTLILPSASAKVVMDGAESTLYSRLLTGFPGPLCLLLYITAIVLVLTGGRILSAVAGFASAGLEVYLALTKVADIEQKVTAQGYKLIKSGPEYGTYISYFAVLGILFTGFLIIMETQEVR